MESVLLSPLASSRRACTSLKAYFLTLRHIVTGKDDIDINLSDGSTLLPSNLLVQIYEYHHTAGVIIQQTGGMTATTKIQDTHKAKFEHVLGRTARFFSMKTSTRSDLQVSLMRALH
jgi:hypothetical protein